MVGFPPLRSFKDMSQLDYGNEVLKFPILGQRSHSYLESWEVPGGLKQVEIPVFWDHLCGCHL